MQNVIGKNKFTRRIVNVCSITTTTPLNEEILLSEYSLLKDKISRLLPNKRLVFLIIKSRIFDQSTFVAAIKMYNRLPKEIKH